MKIVWSKADFESLRALLERELGPDEKLLWCGYTSTAWDTKRSQAYSVQLVSGVGVFVIAGVALSSISNSPEIAVLGLSIVLCKSVRAWKAVFPRTQLQSASLLLSSP